ncbi:hypothetical protein AAG906_022148 [Vitis piasezkii]
MYLGESFEAILKEHEINPTYYNEAMSDIDAHFLAKVYGSRIKPIGCKWVYKKKRGVDGKVETFKGRLVVKGYSQKLGFNYDETFSLAAMLKSIRILLSIIVHFDYEIWQMDVKTAFLNENFDESIYMMQLDCFVAKGQEHMACKLHKSIMD